MSETRWDKFATVELIGTDCWCGLPFALPKRFYEGCKKTGHTFYCPLGHAIAFKESDAYKFRRERDRLKQKVAELEDESAHNLNIAVHQERRVAAYKGQLTKTKNRIKAGVCPCCNRHFTNLERHMTSKHPDFNPTERAPGDDGATVIEMKRKRA